MVEAFSLLTTFVPGSKSDHRQKGNHQFPEGFMTLKKPKILSTTKKLLYINASTQVATKIF